MNPFAKGIIILGIVLIVIGVLWQLAGKYIPLGRLPGDIRMETENVKFYFPVVTCLLISIAASLILHIIRWFK